MSCGPLHVREERAPPHPTDMTPALNMTPAINTSTFMNVVCVTP